MTPFELATAELKKYVPEEKWPLISLVKSVTSGGATGRCGDFEVTVSPSRSGMSVSVIRKTADGLRFEQVSRRFENNTLGRPPMRSTVGRND